MCDPHLARIIFWESYVSLLQTGEQAVSGTSTVLTVFIDITDMKTTSFCYILQRTWVKLVGW